MTVYSSSVACEQAPKWGIRRKEKIARYGGEKERKKGRLPPSLSRPLSELDFCLRPIPHLGACSQAILLWSEIGLQHVRALLTTVINPCFFYPRMTIQKTIQIKHLPWPSVCDRSHVLPRTLCRACSQICKRVSSSRTIPSTAWKIV